MQSMGEPTSLPTLTLAASAAALVPLLSLVVIGFFWVAGGSSEPASVRFARPATSPPP